MNSIIKNTIVIYILLLSFLTLLFTSCSEQSKSTDGNGNSKFKIKNKIKSIGKIPVNVETIIRFSIYNTGNLSLSILKVQPDCQCSTTKWPKRRIVPGDSCEIKIVYKPEVSGPTTQKFYLYTNAEEAPEVLAFKAIVVDSLP